MTRSKITLAAAVFLISSAASASAQSLGGVNLNAYCASTYGADFKAVANGAGAGTWSCQRSQNDLRPISVQKACEQQYQARPIKAVAGASASSWQCVKPLPPAPPAPKVLGGVDLMRYCKAAHGAGFRAVAVGGGAGNWTCERNANDRRPISVQRACQMQYSARPIKAVAVGGGIGAWRCQTP
jgi:hypothetical protein